MGMINLWIAQSGRQVVRDAAFSDPNLPHKCGRERPAPWISASHVISKFDALRNKCRAGPALGNGQIIPFLGVPSLATEADSAASTKNATMKTNITDDTAGNTNTGGNDRHRRLLPVRNSHLAIVVFRVTRSYQHIKFILMTSQHCVS